MKLPTLIAVPLLFACAAQDSRTALSPDNAPASPAASAEPARLLADVSWLADDAREGRRAGTAAGRAAGEWIAARLEALGLEPAGEDGWFQSFEVPLADRPCKRIAFRLDGGPGA